MAAEHARALAAELSGLEVAVGCVRGAPPVEDVADRLRKPAVVVPLLMAEGYVLDLLHRRLAGRGGLRITPPVGSHPGLVHLVAHTAETAARGRCWDPARAVLLLVGHGTPRHPRSDATAAALAARVRAMHRFGAVEVGFLEQVPVLDAVLRDFGATPVVAVGLFVEAGPHGRDDVEAAIGRAPGPVAYTGPLGALPAIRPILRELAGA